MKDMELSLNDLEGVSGGAAGGSVLNSARSSPTPAPV